MIIFTTKVTLKRTVIGLLVLCGILFGINTLIPHAAQTVSATPKDLADQKLKTPEQRAAFVRSFGWEITDEPEAEMEVQIPKTFDETYEQYNALQRQQGLDLTKYCGKRAMLYAYTLSGYPTGEEGVTLSLLLYKNRLIAVDVSAPQADGFVHGIAEHPSSTPQNSTPQTGSTPQSTSMKPTDAPMP